MILYPKLYYKNVQSVDIAELKEHGVKGIAIDIDNTLIDYKQEVSDDVAKWVDDVRNSDIKICILSNSNNKAKVTKVANRLNLDYIMLAKKPLKCGFKKVLKKLDMEPASVASIGDQVFTDVLGANMMNMVSVYVEPINKKEYWYTKWKRPLESYILSKRK